ncbi:ROK family protein [soil metagenome]
MPTIGIDLGGTKIFGARVSHGAERPARKQEAKATTPDGGPAVVVAAIAALVHELGGADRVGVGAPGPVHDGMLEQAPNLVGFDEPVPLAALLSEALDGAAVRVDNDVNAAVLGEHRAGAGRGVDDLLGVWVGTGVGGGLVLGGRLHRGRHGLAGEIGHSIVRPDGHRCSCGGIGHLEAYAGRAAMERLARERHAHGEATSLVELAGAERMKSSVFAKALAAGDAMATDLLDGAVEALGVALASVAATVDVELVVVGGGMADRLGAGFVGRIEEALRSRVFGSSTVRAVPAELGDAAGAVGAALLFED